MILSMVLTPKITELTYSFSFGPTFPRRIIERKSCMLPRGFFISWAILAAISPMALSLSSLSKRSFIFCTSVTSSKTMTSLPAEPLVRLLFLQRKQPLPFLTSPISPSA